jgi:hypothetical protein
MFDFRKLHSQDILLIDIPFHDEFGDNNDNSGDQCRGPDFRLKSLLNLSATSPEISRLGLWYDNCTAHYARSSSS